MADHRAPTPTGAAEIAVPVRLDLLAGLHDLANRHEDAMLRRFERMRADLRSAARALPTPDEILSAKRQKLDLAAARLPAALRDNARGFENRFVRLGQRLERASPRLAVARARAGLDAIGERPQRALLGMTTRLRPKIDDLSSRLRYLYAAGLRERAERLGSRYALLRSYSHHATLERGFAMVTRTDGALVRSGASLDPGEDVRLTFRDGTRHARIKGGDAPSGPENAADPDSQADSASGSAGPVEPRARRSARKPGRGAAARPGFAVRTVMGIPVPLQGDPADAARRQFICAHTRLVPVPHAPEIALHVADESDLTVAEDRGGAGRNRPAAALLGLRLGRRTGTGALLSRPSREATAPARARLRLRLRTRSPSPPRRPARRGSRRWISMPMR